MHISSQLEQRIDAMKEARRLLPLTLGDFDHFRSWQGFVRACLSVDFPPEVIAEFDEICSEMVDQEYPIDLNNIAARKVAVFFEKPHAEFEAKRNTLPSVRVIMHGDPSPQNAIQSHIFGRNPLPELSDIQKAIAQKAKAATTKPTTKAWVKGELLDKEHGPLWYWHHCHYVWKWGIIGSSFGTLCITFAAGVAAGSDASFFTIWKTIKGWFW